MNGGPSGFNNAPVTRTFVIASALFTIFFGMQGRSNKLGLSYLKVCFCPIHGFGRVRQAHGLFHKDIFGKFRFWKLLVSVFAFSSTPELMFGLYLLYYFRVFERQIGSNKYSVFILFSVTVSLLLEVLALSFLKDPVTNLITSGPYGLIFASFVPFFFDIPVSTRFRVFGIHFSDKSFIYLAGLQLLLSAWKRSILPGVCGIVAGLLYRLNIFHIRKAKFPEFVTSLFSRLAWPPVGNLPAAPSRGNVPSFTGRPVEAIYIYALHKSHLFHAGYNEATDYGRSLRLKRNFPSTMPSATEPSEEAIATLVSMGFDRNNARQALVQARNDVNVATNILLEAQSH
ncbi:Ubiquitin-associated domain containing protein [Parasponia andersonii]|uniref:Ubiquitin-associated domain containing protein n=1 Tax=Parasponia andersonii TaxID=3476 RepID=A0A2P5ARA0_PARAD|nr:Ubiquitin-associated domain containing protein [Parasponia andersonii]